ncbi:MAG: bifunctional hydroxymethylpyrimidine kinase/phosphomethylpyrimidine kinase [Deltaproteobacteria bacterium]|nr:bifunctional hydroxymethylpyrimidine kinase/phosphomethylpyrimidine kinase [Deltaproteobacteria bacterium]
MKLKRIMTIAGSDSGGGAGIQADLKTITVLGGFGMSVITALTAQNTLGVHGIHEVPIDFVEKQFDAVATDIGIDAAKTGMLSNSEIIRAVAGKIRHYGVKKLVVDPVMVAKGGAKLIRDEAKETLIHELLPLAFVITPNVPEAEELTGMKIATVEDMKKAAEIIHQMGAKNVFLKGGHMSEDALDVLYDGRDFHEFTSERIDTKNTHGTGCTTSAAIATGLAQGMNVYEAVRRAKDYITMAIKHSLCIGEGHGPTNHMACVLRECERYRCIRDLKAAVQVLKSESCGNIIPEIQSNLVYALPYARGVGEVAAVPGRIVRVGENAETLHDPEFGASSHIARIVLTVMRYDETFRSAMDIRFSEDIVRICGELGYDVDCFSRSDEPGEIKDKEGSSLEWGTNFVLSRRHTIPDAIFDRGDVGKEPVVRILGQTPALVAGKVLNISRRLRSFCKNK